MSNPINVNAQTGAGVGATIGSLLGGPMGTAIGSGIGQAAIGAISAIPKLQDTELDIENKKRLAELKRMQELGTLGLSEQEKQQLFNAQQQQVGGQLQQGQNLQRQMLTGAGQEQLRAAQSAATNAGIMSNVTSNIQSADIAAKQAQIEEKAALTAAVAQRKAEKDAALAAIATGGLSTFIESYGQEQMIQGKMPGPQEIATLAKTYGIQPDEAKGMIQFSIQNPEAMKFFEVMNRNKS